MMKRLPAVTRQFLHFPRQINLICHRRLGSVTGNEKIDKTLDTVTGGKIGGWLQRYENVVGLTEVREAQEKVIEVRATPCYQLVTYTLTRYKKAPNV